MQKLNWIALLLGWGLVGYAAWKGWGFTGDDASAKASILILGATAVVAVWYAYETRRVGDSSGALAKETKRLAEETEKMAGSSRDLALETERLAEETRRMAEKTAEMAEINQRMLDHQWAMQEVSLKLMRRGGTRETANLQLLNQGPGLARDVRIKFEDPVQGERGPLVLEAKDTEEFPSMKARRVLVTARDTMGRFYSYVWEADKSRHHWTLAESSEHPSGEVT